jgi:hypothetical protein
VPWWVWATVFLVTLYLYVMALTLFGCLHLCLMICDKRTKEILTRRSTCWSCCTCRIGCGKLLGAWRRQWCGPLRMRWTLRLGAVQGECCRGVLGGRGRPGDLRRTIPEAGRSRQAGHDVEEDAYHSAAHAAHIRGMLEVACSEADSSQSSEAYLEEGGSQV